MIDLGNDYQCVFRSGGVILFHGDEYVDWFETIEEAEEWMNRSE